MSIQPYCGLTGQGMGGGVRGHARGGFTGGTALLCALLAGRPQGAISVAASCNKAAPTESQSDAQSVWYYSKLL